MIPEIITKVVLVDKTMIPDQYRADFVRKFWDFGVKVVEYLSFEDGDVAMIPLEGDPKKIKERDLIRSYNQQARTYVLGAIGREGTLFYDSDMSDSQQFWSHLLSVLASFKTE